TLTELQHVLGVLIRGIYGDRAYRFKPKYYPYTEPSIGLDIACGACSGKGCLSCHGVGWVTVIGAGMIHPAVLRGFGYDPQEFSGFAFGWGTTRLAYQWLGLEKVKDLYSVNVEDLSFYNTVATNTRVIT
ncbi:MAG: phenylalanine--tRNA ligase subunit alpha, partial [Angustibacter sp.]